MSGSFDLRRLRYFVKVAELGSVTRAAEELHIAQPAVSQQLRALEEDLGVKLMDRGPRGVILTEPGHRMLSEARELLVGMKAMVRRVKENTRHTEGEVVIGVGQTIGSLLMVPLIELAAQRFPRVRIQVREMMSGLLPELVRAGGVDFAISYNTPSGNGIDAEILLSEELCMVGQRRLAERHFKKPELGEVRFLELNGVPLYLSRRGHILRELVEQVAAAKGIRLNLLAEVDSLYIVKELALGGTGFSVLSPANLGREFQHHDVFMARIVVPVIRRDVCLLHRHGHPLPHAAAEIEALAVDAMSSMVKERAWKGALQTRSLQHKKSL